MRLKLKSNEVQVTADVSDEVAKKLNKIKKETGVKKKKIIAVAIREWIKGDIVV